MPLAAGRSPPSIRPSGFPLGVSQNITGSQFLLGVRLVLISVRRIDVNDTDVTDAFPRTHRQSVFQSRCIPACRKIEAWGRAATLPRRAVAVSYLFSMSPRSK
jgi:hypothetical protein